MVKGSDYMWFGGLYSFLLILLGAL
jgi:hypothetical protein